MPLRRKPGLGLGDGRRLVGGARRRAREIRGGDDLVGPDDDNALDDVLERMFPGQGRRAIGVQEQPAAWRRGYSAYQDRGGCLRDPLDHDELHRPPPDVEMKCDEASGWRIVSVALRLGDGTFDAASFTITV